MNLALGFQAIGLKAGILDADIYGPSQPRLLGITGKPVPGKDKRLEPMENYGLKVMSMGFMVDEGTPIVWRGPMVVGALNQMLREVAWGDLDVLVIDMPPGTGDVQLTIAQQVPLAGAVIVSTPQDLALIDARKGLAMFKKVNVPLLGIVENMSYFIAPDTGARYDIFGHGGAKAEAEKLEHPLPRRGAAHDSSSRNVGLGPPRHRDSTRQPARGRVPRHRRQGLGGARARAGQGHEAARPRGRSRRRGACASPSPPRTYHELPAEMLRV